MVLLPKTFKRLDHSKHAQVTKFQVHPCNWSLLPSTVISTFTCVLFHHTCSNTCAQVFQESPGVLPTPQLVPPLQDCCAFLVVPLCTISTVEAMSRRVWLPPLPNVCRARHICTDTWDYWIQVIKTLSFHTCAYFRTCILVSLYCEIETFMCVEP